MLELIQQNLGVVSSYVLAIGTVAAVFTQVIGKLKAAEETCEKVSKLLAVVVDASKDNSISYDEVMAVINSGKDVVVSFENLMAKRPAIPASSPATPAA